MAREGDTYYVSSIGPGITSYLSEDLEHWRWIGRALEDEPSCGRRVGTKLVKLDDSLVRLAEPQEWHGLTRRLRNPGTPDADPGGGAVEAPYIFRKGDWYYLFVSYDLCCRGMDSTYRIMVGRSKSVTGPYVDKDGTPMLEGGGSLVLEGNDNWVALGHNAAYTFDGRDWLVFHAYETADDALQKLRILPMAWEDGWPVVDPADLDRRTTELIGDGPPENDD